MKITTVVVSLLCLAGFVLAGPLRPVPVRMLAPGTKGMEDARLVLLPGTSHLETVTFKARERASVIGVGEGTGYLGLYVYDESGNCVTWDDIATTGTRDDLAAEWYPVRTAGYTIEVRNFGLAANKLELAVR